jgi:transaldolase/glucose-6-phosphate isomerase
MVEPALAAPRTRDLVAAGQSPWLDFISRELLASGELARMVRDGLVTGVTSNPTIFEKAVAGSEDYDEEIQGLAARGVHDPYEAFVALAVADIRAACDVLLPVYEASGRADGFVSLEVPPGIEHERDATVAEALRLARLVDRPNVMIKVPGTAAGIAASEELTARGLNVNVTLLFAIGAYEATAEAYIRGLERRLAAGQPVDSIGSVASFFVSRIDTAVDAQLPAGSPLRGKVAIANARAAYGRFLAIFSGERWGRLAAAGAHVQRPLWASTGTKNPDYSDVLYVENLVTAQTVNTMPAATLEAFLDHGKVREAVRPHLDDAAATLGALAREGVDLDAVTAQLLADGLASFERDFLRLLDRVGAKLAATPGRATLGSLEVPVAERLAALNVGRVVERIWARDHTVWRDDPAEISDRLGWLDLPGEFTGLWADVTRLLGGYRERIASGALVDVVLLGMGGSSLAPEVLYETFGYGPEGLRLTVLDSTHPRQLAAVEATIDLARTVFVVSSKSGTTVETRAHFDYFWALLPDPDHYVVVTDPGSPLEALARERGIARIALNRPDVGGRWSALSYYGLVPGRLIDADLPRLAAGALVMADACSRTPALNPGAWLGAVMAEAALAGRDKLTLVLPPEVESLGHWIEQLIAESTGKDGTGILPVHSILPVEGEDLGHSPQYGHDRLFVVLGDHPGLQELEAAGHPVVRLPYTGKLQLGAEFFRWEFATAVAGHILGIHPFNQPNVQEAKDATAQALAGVLEVAPTPPARELLAGLREGDYLAILAYLPRLPETSDELRHVRIALRDRYRVATTAGFGPRYLHSTGQLHKGGPNSGVFLVVLEDDGGDTPIPGRDYTFARLLRAQALGDVASLQAHGRRVAILSPAALRELAQ